MKRRIRHRFEGSLKARPGLGQVANSAVLQPLHRLPSSGRASVTSSSTCSATNGSGLSSSSYRRSSRGVSPRTRAISVKSSFNVKFVSELPPELLKLLKRWDGGNRLARKKILENFVHNYSHQTSATIEADFGNGGSLLLSRFSSWLKLNRQTGYLLGLQFQALSTFVTASSGASYLSELVESGATVIALDIVGGSDSFEVSSEDTYEALSFLRLVASTGRVYKEVLCEADAIAKVVDCLQEQRDVRMCEICRTVLIELGTGNPKYSISVLRGLLRLLPCKNPFARRIGAQVTRMLISPQSPHCCAGLYTPYDRSSREATTAPFVPVTISMIKSVDIQVQYEGIELLKILAQESNAGPAIVSGILPLLKTVRIQSAKDALRDRVVDEGVAKSYAVEQCEILSEHLTDPFGAGSDSCEEIDSLSYSSTSSNVTYTQSAWYARKANTCLSWQASAARVLVALCRDVAGMSVFVVEAGGIPLILGVLLNSKNEAGQKVALELLSVIVNHVPTAARMLNEVAGIDIWGMMAPHGYAGALKVPMTDNAEITNSIKSVRKKVSAVNVVLDDSDSFISSDVEHLFLSPCEDKDKKTQTKVEIFTTNKNNSVSDDCNDGSDYKEIMEKIIYDSKNL